MDAPPGCERVSVHLVSTYPVRWTEFATLRDFLQNFFDASGPQDFSRKVAISRQGDSTLIEMGGDGFALDWLLHIGASTKTGARPGSTAGYFGEGFKIAALCALRDFSWQVRMGSRDWSAHVVLAPDVIDHVPVRILCYDVQPENTRNGRTWLELRNISATTHEILCGAVRNSFCFAGNPFLGDLLCTGGGVTVWERSNMPLPRDLPYRISRQQSGLLFLAHQARATIPIPFVVALPLNRDHERDRPRLYDFQMIDALQDAAASVSPEVALRWLEALRPHWSEPMPLGYEVGRWAKVVAALVRRLGSSPRDIAVFRENHPELLVSRPIRRHAIPERNRRSAALAWARSRLDKACFVQPAFSLLGIPDVEAACASADGYPKPKPASTRALHRIRLLEAFVADEFRLLFNDIPFPTVDVMETSHAGWRGSAEIHAESERRWSLTGRRIRFRIRRIVMSDTDLEASDPHGALATYLHERCHVFGGDASAGFSAALTDAFGLLARAAPRIVALREAWNRDQPESEKRG